MTTPPTPGPTPAPGSGGGDEAPSSASLADDAVGSPERAAEHRFRVRRAWFVAVVAVLLLSLWGGTAYLYLQSSEVDVFGTEDVASGINITAISAGVDPGRREQTVRLNFFPEGSDFVDGALLTRPIKVQVVGNSSGTSVQEFKAGDVMGPLELKLLLEGDFARYPFDRYTSFLGVSVTTTDDRGQLSPVPVSIEYEGRVTGWVLDARAETVDGVATIDYAQVSRSGSVATFAVLLLLLMVALAVLGCVVAWKVTSRKAKVEATMASWFGAMIFALVPLRTFLPGAPPVGAWIDILILFWVMIMLVLTLSIFVAMWWRTAPPGPPRSARRAP